MTIKELAIPRNLFIAGFVLLLPVQYMPNQVLGSLLTYVALAMFVYGAFIAFTSSNKANAILAREEKEAKVKAASTDGILDVTDNNELVIHNENSDLSETAEIAEPTIEVNTPLETDEVSHDLDIATDGQDSPVYSDPSHQLYSYGSSDSLASLIAPSEDNDNLQHHKTLEPIGLDSFFDDVDSFLASKAKD